MPPHRPLSACPTAVWIFLWMVVLGCSSPSKPSTDVIVEDASLGDVTSADTATSDVDASADANVDDVSSGDVASPQDVDVSGDAASDAVADTMDDALAPDTVVQDTSNQDTGAQDTAVQDTVQAGSCEPWGQAPVAAAKGWPVPKSSCAKASFSSASSGTWQALQAPSETAGATGCVIWRDLDGDGDDDLAWTIGATSELSQPALFVAARTPTGWASPTAYSLELGDEVLDCAAADLDRDGVDDIILATSRGARVWRGGTTAGWQTTDWLPPMARHLPVGALAVVDADRDGWSDLYLARHTIRRDRCAMFDCQGTACKPQAGQVGAEDLTLRNALKAQQGFQALPGGHWGVSGSVSVEDINHDGWPDLWLASTGDQPRGHQPRRWGLVVRLGSGQRPRAASLWLDLNLDGVVDSVSGGMQASQWHGVGALAKSNWADGAPGRRF